MSFSLFFNDTATTEIYTLSLHDALPISTGVDISVTEIANYVLEALDKPPSLKIHVDERPGQVHRHIGRSEEHTSELQLRQYLVCRLLLAKKTHTYALRA